MSGIYIPGMKIPGSCSDCLGIGWNYVFECCLDDAEEGKRLASCPLVPVPEHGRLIDADALMMHKGNCYDADGHLLYAVGTGNIMCAPTIIPADGKGTDVPTKEEGKHITNADRIRQMSDEELAEMMAHGNCGYCKIHDYCFSQKGVDCDEAWLDWLKSPVGDAT